MPAHDVPSDAELIERIHGGDEEAFTMLYHRRQPGLYRFALHMAAQPSTAEEVVQETFLTLIRQVQRYDPTRGSVSAFLFGIARNHVLRSVGKGRLHVPINSETLGGRQPAPDFPAECNDPLQELTRSEDIITVRQAILALPPRYREILVLCEIEGMSYAQAAELTGCAIGTVRSRLHRARAFLRKKLRSAEPARRRKTRRSARCLT